MSYLHELFNCLGVLLGINVPNCIIYTPIFFYYVWILLVSSVYVDVKLISPKHVIEIIILRPYGSKNITKVAKMAH